MEAEVDLEAFQFGLVWVRDEAVEDQQVEKLRALPRAVVSLEGESEEPDELKGIHDLLEKLLGVTHQVALFDALSQNFKYLPRQVLVFFERVELVDAVRCNVSPQFLVADGVHFFGHLLHRAQADSQVCDAACKIQVVEHGLDEEELSLWLQQVVQNDARLFQEPVGDDLVQVAAQSLV